MDTDKRLEQIKNLLIKDDKKNKKKKLSKQELREKKYKKWEIKTVKTGMESPYLGIYVHIPFCARKCAYCDFLSFPMEKEGWKQYLEALKREIVDRDKLHAAPVAAL